MLLPLLTVGLALLCGLQAMEMSHEGSQMDLKEVRQQRDVGASAPRGPGAAVSVLDSGWPAPG